MDDPRDEPADEEFIAQIANQLRAPERLPEDFEARLRPRTRDFLLSLREPRIRAMPSAPARSWWLAPVVRLSPVGALLAAAGVAAIAAMTTLVAARSAPPSTGGVVVHDTVHVLRFALQRHGAREISLVGDFNGWKRAVTPMEPTGVDGMWTVSVPLRAGRHEYAFLVDGVLIPDPLAPPSRDDFGTESSVLVVTE